jgi:hypothetical protein
MSVITGTVYWNKCIVPDRFQEGDPLKWSIDIGNLDTTAMQILETDRVAHRVKNKVEGTNTKGADSEDMRGNFITFTQPVAKRDGTPNRPPRFVDADKNELHPDRNEWLGNGSKVNVVYEASDNKLAAGGRTVYLKTIQVVEQKQYTPSSSADDELDVVAGGFVSDDEIPFPSN